MERRVLTKTTLLREGEIAVKKRHILSFGLLWLLVSLPLAIQAQTDLTCADIAPTGAQPSYYLGLGDGYFTQGNYAPALVAYTCAIDADPTYAPAYVKRGYAFAAQRNAPQALADYNKALELNAELVSAYNNRGVLYTNQGNFGLAITDFTLAVKLDANYAIAYNNRGVVHAAEGNYDLALADIQQAIALDADYAEAHASLGAVYLALAHESYETYGEIAGENAYPPGGDAEVMLESLEYGLPVANFSVWLPLLTPGR